MQTHSNINQASRDVQQYQTTHSLSSVEEREKLTINIHSL